MRTQDLSSPSPSPSSSPSDSKSRNRSSIMSFHLLFFFSLSLFSPVFLVVRVGNCLSVSSRERVLPTVAG